jgi:hypothetical protein
MRHVIVIACFFLAINAFRVKIARSLWTDEKFAELDESLRHGKYFEFMDAKYGYHGSAKAPYDRFRNYHNVRNGSSTSRMP